MSFAVWFTGIPGSGKTALSQHTALILKQKGINIRILELDQIRRFITPSPSYSEEERNIVYASLAYMAKLLTECNVNVFIDATANRRRYRDKAREIIPRFAEVYVRCSLNIAMQREKHRKAIFSPKHIYDKAKAGATIPGVNVAYEEPLQPEMIIDSDKVTLYQGAKKVADTIITLFVEHED